MVPDSNPRNTPTWQCPAAAEQFQLFSRCSVANAIKPGVAQDAGRRIRQGRGGASTAALDPTRTSVKSRHAIEGIDLKIPLEMNG